MKEAWLVSLLVSYGPVKPHEGGVASVCLSPIEGHVASARLLGWCMLFNMSDVKRCLLVKVE